MQHMAKLFEKTVARARMAVFVGKYSDETASEGFRDGEVPRKQVGTHNLVMGAKYLRLFPAKCHPIQYTYIIESCIAMGMKGFRGSCGDGSKCRRTPAGMEKNLTKLPQELK